MKETAKKIILSLLSDNPESLSSMRFSFLFTVLISNLCVFIVWVILCLKNGTSILDVPSGIIYLYALANGGPIAGKLIQKYQEVTNRVVETKIEDLKPIGTNNDDKNPKETKQPESNKPPDMNKPPEKKECGLGEKMIQPQPPESIKKNS